jgi:hypothetical protein
MKPDCADGTSVKCDIKISDTVRLKGTDKRMYVSCIYRQGSETRIKAQWAEEGGDGFVDLSLGLVDTGVESKPVGPLVYKCKCPTVDLSTTTLTGLGVHCSRCGQTKTLACMMIEKNYPEHFPGIYEKEKEPK